VGKELKLKLDDYWNRTRDAETESINDLEKHLWLANGGALVISLGFLQTNELVDRLQFYGAWCFCLGILTLVIMKFLLAHISSRGRFRFQEATKKIEDGEDSELSLKNIRDKPFKILNKSYNYLQRFVGLCFLTGCVLTLIGVGSVIKFK